MPKSKYTRGKDGRFRTAIRTGKYDSEGRPISIRLSSDKSSADLEKKVRDVKYQLEHGKQFIDNNDILLKDYAEKWLSTKEQRAIKTYEMYDNIIHHHLGNLSDMGMTLIRQSDVQLLIKSESHHPRICEQIVLTLRQIFDLAVNDDVLIKNPCRNIELPRHIKKDKRVFTDVEKRIIKEAKGLNEFQRAFIHLLYGTGLRSAEMYALTWNDIDLPNHCLTVNKALQYTNSRIASVGLPKTDKSIRTIPIPDFVIASLLALKALGVQSPTFTLFGLENGELRTRSAYRNIFDGILKRLNLHGITPHCFRHNFCTMCYMNGLDVKTCQFLLGHSDTKMVLEVYTHLDTTSKALSAAVNKIDF